MEYGNILAKKLIEYNCRYGLYEGDKPAVYHPMAGVALTQKEDNEWKIITDEKGLKFYSRWIPSLTIEFSKELLDHATMVYRNKLSGEETRLLIEETILGYKGAVPSIDRLWEIERSQESDIEYVVFDGMDFDQEWEDEFPTFVGVYCDLQGGRSKRFLSQLCVWIWCFDWVVS